MKKSLSEFAAKAKQGAAKMATIVGDLNGDGRVDEEDLKIAVAQGRRVAASVADETARLGKAAARSDLAKDVATGAAIGAAIAIPVPVVGPVAGAAAGAGIGLYKHLKNPAPPRSSTGAALPARDIHAELLKLDDLRVKGILSDDEFAAQKAKLLRD